MKAILSTMINVWAGIPWVDYRTFSPGSVNNPTAPLDTPAGIGVLVIAFSILIGYFIHKKYVD